MDDCIDSYEKFCRAFNNPKNENRAKLLLMIQDWIIRIIDKIDAESSDYSLDTLKVHNSDKQVLCYQKKDAVSRLVDDTYDAIRRISENMRESIIRENVKLPVYKVREVNSYGLNWLSRRPGYTIKQKISSANNSMMAVQRKMSLDTGENRLYMAYLKEIADLIQTKLETLPSNQQRSEEEQFCSLILSIIRNPELEEIHKWENLPPNNTLISDQNYKKIWRGWNELKKLDELISADDTYIAQRICTIFYVEFLTKVSQYVRFPQVPVTVTYEDYSVRLYSDCFLGIDDYGRVLSVQQGKTKLYIEYADKCININFKDTSIQFCFEGEPDSIYRLKGESLSKYVELALVKLGCKIENKSIEIKKSEVKKFQSVVMDLFALRPLYNGDNQDIVQLDGRIMQQTHICRFDDEEHRFDVACDQSAAIVLDGKVDIYTVPIAVENASGLQMSKLMHLLERYVLSQKFVFLFPDIYNEFQLSLVHKAARLAFHEVRAFPRSIGTAFSYLKTPAFQNVFKIGEFLLVLDLVDNDVSLTLLQGVQEESVKQIIPEFRGIVWERHPSMSYSINEEIGGLTDCLIAHGCADKNATYNVLGLDGFDSERNRLTIIYNEQEHLHLSDALFMLLTSDKIDITGAINDFLIKHKKILGRRRVHIVSLSEQLSYKGVYDFMFMDRKVVLEGYKVYEELQKKTKTVLWRDHLPELSIKLLYGKFNLVDYETVTPEFNVEKKIAIKNTFTLSKGIEVYHFHLVQNDVNRKIRYEAIVKNPAFPLAHDVECNLDMTYQYGAEEPYRLIFVPKEKNAEFVEAKVTWAKITEYPCDGMDYPEAVQATKWSAMSSYPFMNDGQIEYVNIIEKIVKFLKAIQRKFYAVNLADLKPKTFGEKGNLRFIVRCLVNDEEADIAFIESNLQKERTFISEDSENYKETKKAGWKLIQPQFEDMVSECVSFELEEVKRYHIDLEATKRTDIDVLWLDKGRGHACYRKMIYENEEVMVAFFENEFENPAEFSPSVTKISFKLPRFIVDKEFYVAECIRNEESGKVARSYNAINIRRGIKPPANLYSWFRFKYMSAMFSGKNSFHDEECPEVLRKEFLNSRDTWVAMVKSCDDSFAKMQLFKLMSLVAEDFGEEYFDIADDYINNYIKGNVRLPDYIGYALGDCTKKAQKSLIEKIYRLEDEKAVCVLSKAVWGNEDFIWNFSIVEALHYFKAAVDYLGKLCRNNYQNGKDITLCLEYILGVFRLRKYDDHGLNNELSLNSPVVQKLYELVEGIIDYENENCFAKHKSKIRSFLKLEVADKGIYQDIPNLVYAILLYITGEKGAGDIKITGLDFNEIEV